MLSPPFPGAVASLQPPAVFQSSPQSGPEGGQSRHEHTSSVCVCARACMRACVRVCTLMYAYVCMYAPYFLCTVLRIDLLEVSECLHDS